MKTEHKETAAVVGLITQRQDEERVKEYLDELSFLIDTAGGTTVKRFIQKLNVPDARTFVGQGKLIEVANYVKEHSIDIVAFDDELTASQIRNLQKILGCKILDRSNLILDIFASRARTAHAKTQVELAQYEYLLPRLTGMWTHLERQRGGIGLRGPGEREIETDRRIIRDRIALLKEKLARIDRQKITQRKSRASLVRVALVGYTNVGKSTLMNLISKSKIFAENKLFATLDTTVRKVVIHNLPFLISDTVGFIRKLPHDLIESFKSTLDEVREADLLLHIVDISHPDFEEQMNIVKQTLIEIQASDRPTIIVFNKTDIYTFLEKDPDDLSPATPKNYTLEEMKHTWMAKNNLPCVFISARTRENTDELKNLLYEEVRKIHIRRYPYNHFLF
ncbi:MAG TPA: GTPase HflX [Bacteroidales bacterium]|nr:GTPase HflX [Bacteroidales bacterium]HNS46367.1 GTPase HflX [Bacteroidales bacterium]